MKNVSPKKNLGQHFLKDPAIAKQIVELLTLPGACKQVLEVGPGMGILTDFLFSREDVKTKIIDIDRESIDFLEERYPSHKEDIINDDFLNVNFDAVFKNDFVIIGNFPYNISTQILFRVLDHRAQIPEVVGMFQKEVAERIAGGPGSREYGILSVFMQAWYDVQLVLTLNQEDFNPPPKVKSAVLHFVRKENFVLPCNEKSFRRVVKASFNQRRKTLRNSLSALVTREVSTQLPFAELRAEALSWQQFAELTNAIEKQST
jgi:16S rRNA (adenine1518-N6/adenine1519-N6)-dimethyltransferase